MRVAIVHDWLTTLGGAEKILRLLVAQYPEAPVYTLVNTLTPEQEAWLGNPEIRTSFLQRLPRIANGGHRKYLPLMPLAIEQFDFTEFDLVISISFAVAKGVITGPDTLHLSYCQSPMRYAWDLQHEYLADFERGWFGRLLAPVVRWNLHRLRVWDAASGGRADMMLGNSGYIVRRIGKCFNRSAEVLYPPVDLPALPLAADELQAMIAPFRVGSFYVAASRLVPYKRLPLVLEAFAQDPQRRPLLVIGDGPQRMLIEQRVAELRQAGIDHVHYLGYQPDAMLMAYLQGAKALVFAAEEDFGILPIEAQALGTPVLALRRGGSMETVQDGVTGLLFDRPEVNDILAAVAEFEEREWSAEACKAHAARFGSKRFLAEWHAWVEEARHKVGLR